MGANPLTFSGLTGMGDLIVTCTSVHSEIGALETCLEKGNFRRSVRKWAWL